MNDNFSTPKQTKRLGLRRTSSILKGSSSKIETSVRGGKKLNDSEETPPCSKSRKIVHSDTKINYGNLEKSQIAAKHVTFVLDTPSRQETEEHLMRQQSVSTNCRPYRLSLSKKVREKMTKKRLEFHTANEMDKKNLIKEQLLAQIEMAREELKARQEHVKKVEELKRAINVWQTGFSTALQDLQQKFDPRVDTPRLLERLHIPQEMLKYIKD